jgi:peptidoglycan/LPS O-acetylase OafA/YrhL
MAILLAADVTANAVGVALFDAFMNPATPSRKSGQIPALDGMRGIAILSVMAFHFSCVFENGASRVDHLVVSLASHGSRGVDLFFVLSGFLITRILIRSRDSVNYLQSFYMRRVLRIFPVYFFYLLIVFGVMRQISPEAFVNARLWPYLAYLSNWQTGTGLKDPGLIHLWSLAVEEQFYLVWPLLVLLCPPRRLMHASVAICLLALGLRITATGHIAPQMVFRMTPFRADTLAAGAVIAAMFDSERKTELIKRFAIPTAGAMLALVVVLRGSFYSQAVEYSIIVVACAAAILLAARHDPGFLRHPLLTTVGKYSYGMYVYHVLLGSLIWSGLKHFQRAVPLGALRWCYVPIAGVSVFAVAWMSYRYLESPFLRLKGQFTPRDASASRVLPTAALSDNVTAPSQLAPSSPQTV